MTMVEEPTTASAPEKEVGKARLRKEDARLITGKTTWTDNMVLPGMLHLAVVRSPVAHAKITNVDVGGGQAVAERRRRLLRAGLRRGAGFAPDGLAVTPDMVNPGHPSIAVDEVNHVGEAVALIVARTKAAAQDAVELVDVDYETLPVGARHGRGREACGGPLSRPHRLQHLLPLRLRRR